MYSFKHTNKMQRYITVNAVRVSCGFSTHHQELKTVHTALGILPDAVCTVFELLMMGGETA